MKAATCALVLPVRLLCTALAPNRLEKVVANQLDNVVEFGPPLKLLINAWPDRSDQKSAFWVWLRWTYLPRLVTVAGSPTVTEVMSPSTWLMVT